EKARLKLDALQKQIADLEAQESKGLKGEPGKAFAALGAFLQSRDYLKEHFASALPEAIWQITPNMFPRQKTLASKAGLSETELHNSIERGRQAVTKVVS